MLTSVSRGFPHGSRTAGYHQVFASSAALQLQNTEGVFSPAFPGERQDRPKRNFASQLQLSQKQTCARSLLAHSSHLHYTEEQEEGVLELPLPLFPQAQTGADAHKGTQCLPADLCVTPCLGRKYRGAGKTLLLVVSVFFLMAREVELELFRVRLLLELRKNIG